MDEPGVIYFSEQIPVFPLPNLVLFPHAVLPLHIFEPRYREMTHDALDGQRVIAMSLLRDGWETDYYGNPPIYPMVCVGRIEAHRLLDDGRFYLILIGVCRATICSEDVSGAYRTAALEPVSSDDDDGDGLAGAAREELRTILDGPPFTQLEGIAQLRKLIEDGADSGIVADLLAFSLLREPNLKQQLLEELDAVTRLDRTIDELRLLERIMQASKAPPGPPSGPLLN
jgi:hypothetical protein